MEMFSKNRRTLFSLEVAVIFLQRLHRKQEYFLRKGCRPIFSQTAAVKLLRHLLGSPKPSYKTVSDFFLRP